MTIATSFPLRSKLLAPSVLIFTCAALLTAAACTSDTTPPPPTPQSLGGAHGHAIHVFAVDGDGTKHRLDFGPGTELVDTSVSSNAPPTLKPQGLQLEAFDAGGTAIVPPPSVGAPEGDITGTAWALVERASMFCSESATAGLGGTGNYPVTYLGVVPWQRPPVGNPNEEWNWFIYPGGIDIDNGGIPDASCAQRLQYEENLLCVADQLGAIADAVGTTVWPALSGTTCQGTFDYGDDDGGGLASGCIQNVEWDIPPQADADRFIVRDLAIHVLGMMATLDATPLIVPTGENAVCPGGTAQCTCASLFADVAEGAATGTNTTPVSPKIITIDGSAAGSNWSENIFGVGTQCPSPGCFPVYPPSNVPIFTPPSQSNAPTIARSALQIEAQMLRAGGRLLHDLVRRDTYSDLAAAAQQEAQALDPNQGNLNAWGLSSLGQYGTYSHAARVLTGRWEIGNGIDLSNGAPVPNVLAFSGHGDPACEGVLAIDVLPEAFGDELSARTQDVQIRTQGEALAADLVGGAGIVIPSCVLGSSTTTRQQLQDALVGQLQQQEMYRNGLSALPPSAVYTTTVGALSDADLFFGFNYALRTYRLITDSIDPGASGGACNAAVPLGCTGSSATCIPLNAAPTAAVFPGVTAAPLYGVVVDGGISRSRLTPDAIARSGGMLEASECFNNVLGWGLWGGTAVAPTDKGPISPLPRVVFQDAFQMGQQLERRLAVLQVAAVPVAGSDQGDPESVALGAIAELRNWAGTVIVQSQGSGQNLTVGLAGEDYSVFGLTGASDPTLTKTLEDQIGFVFGPAWVAECAAHISTNCPANFDANWVQHPTGATDVSAQPPGYYNEVGAIAPVFELTVPYVHPTVPDFNPSNDGFVVPGNAHLYAILLHDKTSPSAQGQVLGVIRPDVTFLISNGMRTPEFGTGISSFVVAPMQRELLQDAINLGKWVGAKPPGIGDLTAADAPGYCVDGVARDVFVPLQNQLTSGDVSTSFENSWQYYLNIAQQAATTADGFAQELINLDLQVAQNEQAAGEQVASLCGDYGSLSQVNINPNGNVVPTATDATLNQCLNEPTTDIAFLSSLPTGLQGASASSATNWIKTNILQCGGTNTDPLCNKGTLSYAALNIIPYQPPASLNQACGQLQSVAASRTTSFNGTQLLGILKDASLSGSSMQSLAGSLKMSVDLLDNWNVTFGGAQIMSSVSGSSLWPACLATAGACGQQSPTNPAFLLNTALRYCPGHTDAASLFTQPLGCDGAINGQSAAAAELNVLRWRVAGALWMIAASAGGMPAQMFNIPVPVVLLPATGQGGGSLSVPAPEGYDGTRWLPTGHTAQGLLEYSAPPDPTVENADDSTTLGVAYPVQSAFSAFTNNAGNEIPGWYMGMYAPSTLAYTFHALTGNSEVAWTNCTAGEAIGNTPCTGNPDDPSQPQKWNPTSIDLSALLATGASDLDGLACATRWGNPSQGPSNPTGSGGQSLRDLIDAFKTGYSQFALGYSSGTFGGNPYISPGIQQACPIQNNVVDEGWGSVQCVSGSGLEGQQAACSGPGITVSGCNGLGSPAFSSVTQAAWPTAQMPPWQRTFVFTNLTAENGVCNAIAQLIDAAAVACATQDQAVQTNITTTPPQVNTQTDIFRLEAWLNQMSAIVHASVQGLYAENIPSSAVSDFQNGTLGSGAKSGQHGSDILSLEQSMQDVPTNWGKIGVDFAQVSNAIESARLSIQSAGLQNDDALEQIALQQMRVQADMVQASLNFESSIISTMGSVVSCVGSAGAGCGQALGAFANMDIASQAMGDSINTDRQELSNLANQASTANSQQQLQIQQAIVALNNTTGPLWSDIQTSLDNLRKAVLAVLQAAGSVQQTSQDAQYQAAIAAGNDFVVIAGQQVPIPVNTVLNRQMSATAIRYQNALTNAKALAYMARRAIEQRIGIPLSAITTPVGPMDAPASWADDVCSLTGINYQSLATPTGADAGGQSGATEQAVITQFADSFVGDYVTKLSNFVTYFNVQYPSHEGNDTAILSLRYDLMPSVPQCSSPARNLLLYSGQLDHTVSTAGPGLGVAPGWQLSACPSDRCLATLSGAVLPNPDGPAGAHQTPVAGTGAFFSDIGNGVTWLSDVAQTGGGGGGDAGADGGTATIGPAGVVFQAVSLDAGSYVLSWWDQARDGSGNVVVSTSSSDAGVANAVPYVVRVFDGAWNELTTYQNPAFVPASLGAPQMWSSRLSLPFTASQAGVYYVAFGASTANEGLGSVAIADVQLEASSQGGVPTTYQQTGDSTMVMSTNCTPSDSDMRAAFQHRCDQNGTCWYDLTTPIIVDTQQLQNGTSPISGKLAPGNFNFRHVDLAVNLVGTNVHDCTGSPTPDCYGSAYIQYTLGHDGTNAGILDWNGNSRAFDFGVASINSGKALAAERYITLPISSDDESLLSQSGIQHIELRGRPLDGSYTLRIWDSPALNWNNLQDVQIVLDYLYWSEIIANGNAAVGQIRPLPSSKP